MGAQHGMQAIAELPAAGCLAAGARAVTQLSAHYLLAAALQSGGAQGTMLARATACIFAGMPKFLDATPTCAAGAMIQVLRELIAQWRAALLRWLKALNEPGSPLEVALKALYRITLVAEGERMHRYFREAVDVVEGSAELQSALAKARAR